MKLHAKEGISYQTSYAGVIRNWSRENVVYQWLLIN